MVSKQSSGHKIVSAKALVILGTVVFIITVCGFVGISVYAGSSPIQPTQIQPSVQVSCSASGDDLFVHIQDGSSADSLVQVGLIIEGYDLPSAVSLQSVPLDVQYPKKICYKGVTAGIKGEVHVLLDGVFKDGTKRRIASGYIRIT
ncbi:MAG: hypothetical protein Q4Q04_03255 [Methanocorpusculum sp.]|nr:hypothetical protein [Methanocorpusculum sp.]